MPKNTFFVALDSHLKKTFNGYATTLFALSGKAKQNENENEKREENILNLKNATFIGSFSLTTLPLEFYG